MLSEILRDPRLQDTSCSSACLCDAVHAIPQSRQIYVYGFVMTNPKRMSKTPRRRNQWIQLNLAVPPKLADTTLLRYVLLPSIFLKSLQISSFQTESSRALKHKSVVNYKTHQNIRKNLPLGLLSAQQKSLLFTYSAEKWMKIWAAATSNWAKLVGWTIWGSQTDLAICHPQSTNTMAYITRSFLLEWVFFFLIIGRSSVSSKYLKGGGVVLLYQKFWGMASFIQKLLFFV